jgi:hypothetical protein
MTMMLVAVWSYIPGISHLFCATLKHLVDGFYYLWLHILRDFAFVLTEEFFPVILEDSLDDLIGYIPTR